MARLGDDGLVTRSDLEFRFDDKLEIQRAAVPREMRAIPAQPADRFKLTRLIVGPEIRTGFACKIAHDRVRLPQGERPIFEDRQLAVRILPKKFRRLVRAGRDVKPHECDRLAQMFFEMARRSTDFVRVEKFVVIELHRRLRRMRHWRSPHLEDAPPA